MWIQTARFTDKGAVEGGLVSAGLNLLSGAANSLVVVLRRSSDDAEKTFYFSSEGFLPTPQIETWAAGSDFFVKELYNQDDRTNNFLQETNDNQPKLGTAGVVNADAFGNPWAVLDGTNDNQIQENDTDLSSATHLVISWLGKTPTTSAAWEHFVSQSSNTRSQGSNTFYFGKNGADGITIVFADTIATVLQINSTTDNLDEQQVFTIIVDIANGIGKLYVNGVFEAIVKAGSWNGVLLNTAADKIAIGSDSDGAEHSDINHQSLEILTPTTAYNDIQRKALEDAMFNMKYPLYAHKYFSAANDDEFDTNFQDGDVSFSYFCMIKTSDVAFPSIMDMLGNESGTSSAQGFNVRVQSSVVKFVVRDGSGGGTSTLSSVTTFIAGDLITFLITGNKSTKELSLFVWKNGVIEAVTPITYAGTFDFDNGKDIKIMRTDDVTRDTDGYLFNAIKYTGVATQAEGEEIYNQAIAGQKVTIELADGGAATLNRRSIVDFIDEGDGLGNPRYTLNGDGDNFSVPNFANTFPSISATSSIKFTMSGFTGSELIFAAGNTTGFGDGYILLLQDTGVATEFIFNGSALVNPVAIIIDDTPVNLGVDTSPTVIALVNDGAEHTVEILGADLTFLPGLYINDYYLSVFCGTLTYHDIQLDFTSAVYDQYVLDANVDRSNLYPVNYNGIGEEINGGEPLTLTDGSVTQPPQPTYTNTGRKLLPTIPARIFEATVEAAQNVALSQLVNATDAQISAINTLVRAEMVAGNWQLMDEFWLLVLGSTNSLIGLKSGTVAVNNGGATFSVQGVLTDGAASYLDTTLIPSSSLTLGTLDDMDVSAFMVENLDTGDNVTLFGATTTDSIWMNQIFASVRLTYYNNATAQGISLTHSSFNDSSLYQVNRIASTDQQLYIDGSQVDSEADSSSSLPTKSIFIGARNISGSASNFLNAHISSFKIGGAIGFDSASHYSNLLECLIELNTFSQPVLDRFTGLSATESAAIKIFVDQCVRDNTWNKIDEQFIFPLGSSNGLIGLKGLATAVNNGSVSFSSKGALTNGTDNYLDTTLIPSSSLTKGTLDDMDVSAFMVENLDSNADKYLFGVFSTLGPAMRQNSNISGWINSGTSTTYTTGETTFQNETLYQANRIASTDQQIYIDGVQVVTQPRVSASTATRSISIGALNNNGTIGFFLNAHIGSFKVGSAINFDSAAYNTALRTLLTSLGTI